MSVKARFMVGLIGLWLCCPANGVLADTKQESEYGFFSDRQIVLAHTLVFNEALQRRISDIGDRVVRAAGQPGTRYTYRVVNDPTINAYSTASGFLYINTGLLDILESEDELAAVMAHEIAHVHDHHLINFAYAAYRRQVAGEVAGILLAAALGAASGMAVQSAYGSPDYANSPYAQQAVQQAVDAGMRVGISAGDAMAISLIKGYGKKQELKADAFAIRYTRKAGYDPTALVGVLRKLASIKGRLGITKENYVSGFINAEPGLDARIKSAQKILAKGE